MEPREGVCSSSSVDSVSDCVRILVDLRRSCLAVVGVATSVVGVAKSTDCDGDEGWVSFTLFSSVLTSQQDIYTASLTIATHASHRVQSPGIPGALQQRRAGWTPGNRSEWQFHVPSRS